MCVSSVDFNSSYSHSRPVYGVYESSPSGEEDERVEHKFAKRERKREGDMFICISLISLTLPLSYCFQFPIPATRYHSSKFKAIFSSFLRYSRAEEENEILLTRQKKLKCDLYVGVAVGFEICCVLCVANKLC